jgi:hypothetical protein
VSVFELFVLLTTLFTTYKFSKIQQNAVLEILKVIIPNLFKGFGSSYNFQKMNEKFTKKANKQGFCEDCEKKVEVQKCTTCGKQTKYFYYFSLKTLFFEKYKEDPSFYGKL